MTKVPVKTSYWGERAASLYDDQYARRYRDCDEELLQTPSYQQFIDWLRDVCGRFDHPIEALDLGCGTGRYFWGLQNVAALTGIDASEAMLAEAAHPIQQEQITAGSIALILGDLELHDFDAAQFDLVYSIGVLAEHVPLDASLVGRVWRWLKPGGRFAFTTVDPSSPSVHRTVRRRLAEAALPLMPGDANHRLHARLMANGLYADERWIREQLAPAFAIETFELFRSDVHLHGRCVARKVMT
ncbi:MAG: class I SAM-dependent methyltransferase [Vicinamibacterales bacterium]